MKTRKHVEIARTGTFKLSTGDHTFTREQFEAAVRNAQTGPAPTIGIGHTDPRFNTLGASDGEPALGRVENLQVDGDVLYGDMVDLPDWFDAALPSAFPRRSLEGPCEADNLTINSVKVLGLKKPGIHTLADLKEYVSDDGPALIAAGADNDGHDFTVLLEPSDTFTFSDLTRVAEQYVDQLAAAAGDDPNNQEVVRVDPKKMREALGLPEDATDEQVTAKFNEQLDTSTADPRTDDPAPETDPANTPEAETDTDPEATTEVPEGMALVDEQALAGLQASAARADELFEQDRVTKRNAVLDKAQREGRIPLARREHYATMYDQDQEGAVKLLTASAADGGLAPGLVPVNGPKGNSDLSASSGQSDDLYERTRQHFGLPNSKEA